MESVDIFFTYVDVCPPIHYRVDFLLPSVTNCVWGLQANASGGRLRDKREFGVHGDPMNARNAMLKY